MLLVPVVHSIKIKKRLKLVCCYGPLFLLVLLLTSCSKAPQIPMRVGTNLWPGYEPLYLAQHLDYFDSQTIKLVEYPSASEVLRAFRNHTLEAAALTLDEVLTIRQDHFDVQIVLVLDISHGADVIIGDHHIEAFHQLKNKRVAIESTALGAYLFTRALQKHHMSSEDIIIEPMDVSEHEAAFRQKKVDAAVTFEPIRTKLLAIGGNEIFSSKELPGEIIDVLVIRKDHLEKHPKAAKQLAKAWFKALNYIEKQPKQFARLAASRLKLSPSKVLQSYQGLKLCHKPCNQKMLNHKNGVLKTTVLKMAETMVNIDLLESSPDLEQIISDQLIIE